MPKNTDRTKSERYKVNALARGLAVLTCFNSGQTHLRMTDIVKETGLTMSTVFRLVHTLVGEGYLDELEDGRLRPGLAVIHLGLAPMNGLDIIQAADERLRTLATRSRETVNLAIRDGKSVVYLIRIKNQALVTADLHVGSRLPVYCSSMGKVLLAYASSEDQGAVLEELDFDEAEGPNALRDQGALRDELARVRARGWSVQDEELTVGLKSIAAPIVDSTQQVVAAINLAVAAHLYSIGELIDCHLDEVLSTADAISLSMGGLSKALRVSPSEVVDGADG